MIGEKTKLSIADRHDTPQPARDAAPQSREDAPSPIDDGNVAVTDNCTDNGSGNLLRLHCHGIRTAIVDKRGAYEAGTDVSEADWKMTKMRLLLESLYVDVVESLSGTIGRSGSQALCAGYRRQHSYVAATVFSKPTVRRSYHSGKAKSVGFDSPQFLISLKRHILPTYTGDIQVHIHASKLINKPQQTV